MKEKKRFKIRPKYIIAAAILGVFSLFYLFDAIWAKTYHVEIIYVSDMKPLANQKERVEIQIQVTHFGKAMEGHEIFALPTAGKMRANNAVTDAEGKATFVYIPFTSSLFTPAEDVEIVIRDESNSIFWEVNASVSLTLELQDRKVA